MKPILVLTAVFLGILAISAMGVRGVSAQQDQNQSKPQSDQSGDDMGDNKAVFKHVIFAGGCFWCMESPYEDLDGVIDVVSGYAGGNLKNPTYEQVSTGITGHYETVEVTYNPAVISFDQLVEVFWRNVDPFDETGQFCDEGSQYRTAIFVNDESERAIAEASKEKLEKRFGKSFATKILDAAPFYKAEEYHQNYCRVNPIRYKMYRGACGRDHRLEAIWGDEAGGHDIAPGANSAH